MLDCPGVLVVFRAGGGDAVQTGRQDVDVTSEAVQSALRDLPPETIRSHAVRVEGQLYPAKKAVAAATGLDRLDFTTVNARRVLQRLGFEVVRVGKEGDA